MGASRLSLFLGAAFGGALMLLSPAFAQDVTRARLLTLPDAAAFAEVFPPVALATGVSGRVMLACRIALDGASECSVEEEAPAGLGFGAAATDLAQAWRFAPRTENDAPVESVARVPVLFSNGNGEPRIIESDTRINAPAGADDATARFYPEQALRANISGRALVACAARADGAIDCAVERESPEGYGLGASALAAVRDAMRGALAPGEVVRAPVDFNLRTARGADWAQRPDGRDFARLYPARALQRGLSGGAVLICAVRGDGGLDCAVEQEQPAGQGFGAAALQLSAAFQLAPEALGAPGRAPGDRFRLPISFRVDE
jgi:TonB family protein